MNIPIEYRSTLLIFLPLYTIFNAILDSGIASDEWLLGIVKPIYKNKGDPTSPGNYCPITLFKSCLRKLFPCNLNGQLETFANEVDLINENQAGFRKSYSAIDHVLSLQFLSQILMSRKKNILFVYRF